jgi:hypothetical protein
LPLTLALSDNAERVRYTGGSPAGSQSGRLAADKNNPSLYRGPLIDCSHRGSEPMSVLFRLVLKYGVMSTAAVVVNGQKWYSGGHPDRLRMAAWL